MTGHTNHRQSERGEGNWGNIVMLIVSLFAAVAAVNAGPVFMKNFEFGDKITEASRSFSPGQEGDKKAMAFNHVVSSYFSAFASSQSASS